MLCGIGILPVIMATWKHTIRHHTKQPNASVLNRMARDGWELIGVLPSEQLGKNWAFYWKRLEPEEDRTKIPLEDH